MRRETEIRTEVNLEPRLLTPDWLLVNGFHRATTQDGDITCYVSYTPEDHVLVEGGIHRNLFCVVMTPEKYTTGGDMVPCGFLDAGRYRVRA